MGGRHAGLGTWNAILPLEGGVYVELIAADPGAPRPAGPRPFGLDGLATARLVTWAARTDDMESTVSAARERGFDPGQTIPLSRETPAGERLEWTLTVRAEPAGEGLVPFLIDWQDSPHPAASAAPARCRLERFHAQARDSAAVRAALDALGLDAALALEAAVSGQGSVLFARLEGPAGQLELSGR